MITIVLPLLACGLIGAMIGAKKGRKGTGLAYGLVLGPLGWIVMFLAEPAKPGEKPFSVFGIVFIVLLIGGATWALMPSAAERKMNAIFQEQTPEERQLIETQRKTAQYLAEHNKQTSAPVSPSPQQTQPQPASRVPAQVP